MIRIKDNETAKMTHKTQKMTTKANEVKQEHE